MQFKLDPDKKKPKNGKKIEKIKKPLSDIIFSQYGDEIGRKREKKLLVKNSIHTWPREENSEKKIAKKFKKLKNLFLALFLAKNRLDGPRKRK